VFGRRARARGLKPERGAGSAVAAERSEAALCAERKEFGKDYYRRRLALLLGQRQATHPDTITRRFEKIAAQAGLPEIDLHDVRHSYATAGRNAKIDWKALSRRIGHADVAFTMKQYVQTDLEADREVANTLADLIIGAVLASVPVQPGEGKGRDDAA